MPLGDILWVVRVPRKRRRLNKKELKKLAKAKTKKKGKVKNEHTSNSEVLEEEKIEDDGHEDAHLRTFPHDNDVQEEQGELLDPENIDFKNPDHYHEYVLNLIVERKTANDLASSIRDGRYTEQKSRM